MKLPTDQLEPFTKKIIELAVSQIFGKTWDNRATFGLEFLHRLGIAWIV